MNDLAACLPQSVTLLAPHTDGTSGQPDGTFDSYVITLASLGLPEFSNVAGFPGTKPLRTTAIDTTTVLTALARQAATDWYEWQRARHDVRLAGCQPWQPDGLTDVLEWVDTAAECSTRAYRGVWADLADQLYHAGSPGPGPGPNPTPPSATVSPPGGTEVHPAPQEFPGPVLTTGPLTTGGPVTTQGTLTVTNGPLTLPPKPGTAPASPGSIYYDPVTNQIVFVGPGPSYAFVSLSGGGGLEVLNVDGTQDTNTCTRFRVNNDPTNGFLEWTNETGGVGHISWTGLLVHKPGAATVGPHQTIQFDDDGGVTGVACTVTDDPPNQTIIKYSWNGLQVLKGSTTYGPEKVLEVQDDGTGTTGVVQTVFDDTVDGRVIVKTVWKGLTVQVDPGSGPVSYGPEQTLELSAGQGIRLTGFDDTVAKKVQVTIATSADPAGITPWGYHDCGTGPNRRYFGGVAVNTSAPSSNTFAANTLYAVPFIFAAGGSTIDLIGCKINSGGTGGHFRLGVYTNTSSTNPFPNSLLADSGQLTVSGGVQEAAVSVGLAPGSLYWLALLIDTTAAGAFWNSYAGSAQGMWPILGGDAGTYGGVYPLGWSAPQTYGALPGTFPAGTLLVTGGSNLSIPQLGVRILA